MYKFFAKPYMFNPIIDNWSANQNSKFTFPLTPTSKEEKNAGVKSYNQKKGLLFSAVLGTISDWIMEHTLNQVHRHLAVALDFTVKQLCSVSFST